MIYVQLIAEEDSNGLPVREYESMPAAPRVGDFIAPPKDPSYLYEVTKVVWRKDLSGLRKGEWRADVTLEI